MSRGCRGQHGSRLVNPDMLLCRHNMVSDSRAPQAPSSITLRASDEELSRMVQQPLS